jgi:Lrp/AsnC family leucine-responsive transcriptional regulator
MPRTLEIGRLDASLDEKDWIILELIQIDGRLPFAELGRRAGLSPPAAAERLRRLEDAGLINGYHARVSPDGLGLSLTAFVEIQVKRADYARFLETIKELTWVLECHHVSGRASFLLKVAVPGVEGLEQLVAHLGRFGETSTSLILSTAVDRRMFLRPSA